MLTRGGVRVDHEWDPLREAVVGRAHIRLGWGVPRLARKYTPANVITMAEGLFREYAGSTLREALPVLHGLAEQQMAGVVEILRGRGVIVHEVSPYTDVEAAYLSELGLGTTAQYYPRDPIVVVGEALIESAMRMPTRRSERFPIRRTLAHRVDPAAIRSLPEPAPEPEGDDGSFGPGPFLEGGDVFVLGRDVWVGVSGNASNEAGVAALAHLLRDTHTVHAVPMTSSFLHLDCVLATPREGLALVCRDGFADGLPAFLDGWDIIEVSAADAEQRLATNVLVLDPQTVLVAAETPEIAEALARAGQDVITAEFSAVLMWGGAFRCWHHPLVRTA